MSNASQAYLKSLAASGATNVDIALDGTEELAVIQVSANYGVVATVSGIGSYISLSADGTLFTVSNSASLLTITPAANVTGTQQFAVPLGNNPTCADAPRRFTTLRVALANADATNAAAVSVVADLKTYPR